MIIPDINLLLYAHVTGFAQHAAARTWWEKILGGHTPVGLAMPVLFGFIRIATQPRILEKPMAVSQALRHVRSWIDQPTAQVIQPGPRHLQLTFQFLEAFGVAGNLTMDCQLAALAVEHQAEVHSADADFSRFRGVRWLNPLDD